MSTNTSNQSQLYATIDNKKVTLIKGVLNEKINRSYTGEFTLTTDGKLSPKEMIRKKISFSMSQANTTTFFHGIVTKAASSPGDRNTFIITLESPLSLMANRYQSRAFSHTTTEAVLRTILTEHAFQRSDLIFKLSDDDQHDYYEQHQTTDLAFFHRILAEQGIAYYFMPNEHAVSLCMDDQSTKTSADKINTYPFIPGLTGDIHQLKIDSFKQSHRPEITGVQLHGYDSASPSMAIQADAKTPSLSLMEMKPANATQLKKAQKHRLESLNTDSDTVELTCNIPDLMPGKIFNLSQHPDQDMNRHYRVIESIHTWDESGADLRYHHKVIAAPVNMTTRPKYDITTQTIPHLSLATVKGETTRANLTDKGEYFVQALDMNETESTHAPVRQSQSFVGNGYGMHFPLLNNTEVIMARVNGHPDKPVILGALYNESNVNPVSGNNPYLNLIKTQAGNALLMNDTPDYRSIALQTAEEENQLILDASQSLSDIRMNSKTGGFSLQTGGAASWSTQSDVAITAQESMMFSAQSMALSATQKTLSLNAGGNMTVSSHDLILNVEENVTHTIQGTFWHTVLEDCDFVSQGKLSLMAEEGSVHLQSSSDNIIVMAEAGSIQMSVGESIIEFDESGSCVVRAHKITLQAAEINMQNAGTVMIS